MLPVSCPSSASLQDLTAVTVSLRAPLFLCAVPLNSSGLPPASLACPHLTVSSFPFTLCLRAGAARESRTFCSSCSFPLKLCHLGRTIIDARNSVSDLSQEPQTNPHPLWMSCRCLGLNMPQTHHPTPPQPHSCRPVFSWEAQVGLWLLLALILPVLLLSRFC